jgi:hypothetical protein
VTAWAQGGNVPATTIRLMAAPASLKPTFSFGCGSHDGSTSCDLGTLDAKSAQRQLQAKIAVAASATTVTSVRLTATASTAGLTTDPQASATVSVTPAATPAATNSATPSAQAGIDVSPVSPLPAGNLPYLPSASPVLSPGGNAAGLFPTITPSADPPATTPDPQKTQPVADTSALPQDGPVIGAQVAGLAVLALAFVLAVARMSFRKRPAPARSGPASSGKPADPPDPPGEPPADS